MDRQLGNADIKVEREEVKEFLGGCTGLKGKKEERSRKR